MKTITYKGHTAEIIYSDEDECFVGRIVNIDAISGFHGDADDELRVAFEDMVDLRQLNRFHSNSLFSLTVCLIVC